jgi:hypothetical protein
MSNSDSFDLWFMLEGKVKKTVTAPSKRIEPYIPKVSV